MSRSRQTKHRPRKKPRGRYLLRLFMAGNGQNSKTALTNLRSLCKEHLNGSCTIETVDVVKDFQAAVRHRSHSRVWVVLCATQELTDGMREALTSFRLSDQIEALRIRALLYVRKDE